MLQLILTYFFSLMISGTSSEIEERVCVTPEEVRLYDLINDYRDEKKLLSVSLSSSLTQVAQAHVRDLMDNYKESDKCNPHSWSRKGDWTHCCYTSDHKKASCMWDKPKEIAGYESPGYEIAFWHSKAATAEGSLEGWKKSKSHNPLLINKGQWAKASWKAIGIGIYEQYAVVWFGEMKDKKPPPMPCM